MTNYLTKSNGDEYGPRLPFVTDNLDGNKTASTSETLTYNGKAAAGAITISPLSYNPVMSALGDRVASYWGLSENLVYTSNGTVVVVETDGSATAAFADPNRDLELAYESLTGTVKRFVLKVTDNQGNSLYGWIMGVAKSTNLYTFDIFNHRLTEGNQNWVGSQPSFDATTGCKAEIFRYTSSISFGTETTLTKEVRPPSSEYLLDWKKLLDYASDTLTNGEWFCDYFRSLIVGKKADTTASETVTYNIKANAEIAVAGGATLIDDAAFGVGTSAVTPVGFLADETATDSVNEGDVGAARMTLDRKLITSSEFKEDSVHASTDYGTFVLGVENTAQTTLAGAGDYIGLSTDVKGNQMVVGNIASSATDAGNPVKIGGVYNATPATLTDGQRGTLQLDTAQNVKMAEQFAPNAEDQTNNVIAIAQKPLAVSTYTYSRDSSSALEASSISKASAGNLYRSFGVIDATAPTDIYYILHLDSATLTGDGAVTHLITPIPVNHTNGTDSSFDTGHFDFGVAAANGIVIVASTTMVTKTIITSNYLFATVLYK